MKEYFSHDYNARNDPRLVNLNRKNGLMGIGLYWCLIEMLYESNGKLMLSECDRIAYELRIDCELILSLVKDKQLNLFKTDKKIFWSESVNKRLDLRKEKSNKAKYSASVRWSNANALQTQSEGNAIKLNKSKVNKIKEKYKDSIDPIFLPTVEKWLKYKKDRKESYKSDESILTFYSKLCKLSNSNIAIANEIIEQSMANNWAGIFELKKQVMDQIYDVPR